MIYVANALLTIQWGDFKIHLLFLILKIVKYYPGINNTIFSIIWITNNPNLSNIYLVYKSRYLLFSEEEGKSISSCNLWTNTTKRKKEGVKVGGWVVGAVLPFFLKLVYIQYEDYCLINNTRKAGTNRNQEKKIYSTDEAVGTGIIRVLFLPVRVVVSSSCYFFVLLSSYHPHLMRWINFYFFLILQY